MQYLSPVIDFENIRYEQVKRDNRRIMYKSVGYLTYESVPQKKLVITKINGKKSAIYRKFKVKKLAGVEPLQEQIYIVYRILKKCDETKNYEKKLSESFFGIAAWTFFDEVSANSKYEAIYDLNEDHLEIMINARKSQIKEITEEVLFKIFVNNSEVNNGGAKTDKASGSIARVY